MKTCTSCKKILPVSEFYQQRSKINGYQAYCKSCHNEKNRNNRRGPGLKLQIIRSARARAKKKDIPCSLKSDDFEIPEFCPILGIKLNVNMIQSSMDSPTLDRIIPELGYIPGNVQVISWRANRMKNDATREELRSFAAWVIKEFPEDNLGGL